MSEPPPTAVLVDVLRDALTELWETGRDDRANRLAAAAYVRLRRTDPEQAQRLNALMHKLSRPPRSREKKEE
jgi:hypothetical protein